MRSRKKQKEEKKQKREKKEEKEESTQPLLLRYYGNITEADINNKQIGKRLL